jgi:hypothetical protein
MTNETIEIWVELCGQPERDVWCPTCSLPSAIITGIAMGHQGNVMKLCKRFFCPLCQNSHDLPGELKLLNEGE